MSKNILILQNISKEDEQVVGRSIFTLSRFANEKLPVSNGFVLTTNAYNIFLNDSQIRNYYENNKKSNNNFDLENTFNSLDYPYLLKEEVSKSYSKISGFTDAFVNIRALILNNKGEEVEHRAFTILDIRGQEELIQGIKSIYKNVISEHLHIIEKFFDGSLKIVLLVQRAQQSEASGILYTTDITTQDKNKLVIEAVFGLESIFELEPLVPDQYIFDKNLQQITEKHISSQTSMAVRHAGRGKNGVQKIDISPVWQKRQKLDDKHLLTLAKIGSIIEQGLGEAQEIIWSYEAGKIWINFIESSQKLTLHSQKQSIQEKIDSEVKSFVEKSTENVQKEVLVDFLLSDNETNSKPEEKIIEPTKIFSKEPEEIKFSTQEIAPQEIKKEKVNKKEEKKEPKPIMKEKEKTLSKKEYSNEPLLEGKYFCGEKAEGEVCMDPNNPKPNSILVLKGDENLPSNIEVKGFVIEDDSEILAVKLNEFFNIPVITGVPLARKILKSGELIVVDGKTGSIFETIPYTEQVGELEMNFSQDKEESLENEEIKKPLENELIQETKKPLVNVDEKLENNTVSEPQTIQIESTTVMFEPDTEINVVDITVSDEQIEKNSENVNSSTSDAHEKNISQILDLVEETPEIVEVKEEKMEEETNEPNVDGVSEIDQFNAWGKSLAKILSVSKEIHSTVATEAIENITDDQTNINTKSKEFSYDEDEEYIASSIQNEEKENPKYDHKFIPTATKVYVHLVDQKLPEEFKNFDGIIFSSSFDQEFYIEILEDILAHSEGKEVLAICPPYETEALNKFFELIYNLRNNGNRNLSLVLPDYRNKKEIAELKKQLSQIGLKRTSTFSLFANISRTINVFRLKEVNTDLVDGVFIDLFRLKMNMLGVEKQTASTKYVEGMRNIVSYIDDSMNEMQSSIIDIRGFKNPKKVVEHISEFKFMIIATSLPNCNLIKNHISAVETQKIISGEKKQTRRVRRRG